MGKFIQVRVSAATFDPGQAAKAFPKLYAVAWPAQDVTPEERKGLFELTDQLSDLHQFGDLAPSVKQVVGEQLPRIMHLRRAIETALGDWQPTEAERLTTQFEDALAGLEAQMPD